jgi:hypothetical protein
MEGMTFASKNHRLGFLLLALLSLLSTLPATAKIATDFDPNLDFSKLKSFAFIGGVEQLVRMQLNPDLLNDRIHRAVSRELTAKGLHEVTPEENPDLVVRYWANSQKNFDAAASTNWGVYGPYYDYHWGFTYYLMDTYTTHEGTLGIELIAANSRDLAWRMFASAKITERSPKNLEDCWQQYQERLQALSALPKRHQSKEATVG